MKKHKYLLLLFSIVFFQSTILLAQSKTSIGAKLGLNYSKQYIYSNQIASPVLSKIGIYVGVPIELKFSKLFAFQIEPSFIQKGYKYFYGSRSYSVANINYLELPIFLKLLIGEKIQFNIVAGSSAAVAIGGGIKTPSSPTQLLDFKNGNYNRYDFCLQTGTGLKIPVKKRAIIIDIRYCYGLYDISKENSNTTKVNNRGLVATTGVMF